MAPQTYELSFGFSVLLVLLCLVPVVMTLNLIFSICLFLYKKVFGTGKSDRASSTFQNYESVDDKEYQSSEVKEIKKDE